MKKRLSTFKLFQTLSDTELTQLAHLAYEKNLKAGDYLFHQNDDRKEFFLIESGVIEIVKSAANNIIPIIKLDNGNFVSENALLDSRPHGSSALCSKEATLIVFDKNKLSDLLEKNALIAGKIFPELAKTLADRLYKMNTKTSELETRTYSGKYRLEHDLLGDKDIPDDVYYGVQTLRAIENFDITGITLNHFPVFIKAFAIVKKACALSNYNLGHLDKTIKDAIIQACDELIEGEFLADFVVDMIQGGAGTSTNMNVNEVIANRASEILGHAKGSYFVHPNNHVNLSQSTNDAYPTAIRLSILLSISPVLSAMQDLKDAFLAKGKEFNHVIKMGRTQLQDAVPMTLGQEFTAFGVTIGEDIERLKEVTRFFREVNLGGTAIGTGINADPKFGQEAINEINKMLGTDLVLAENLIEATPDTGAFISFSSILKRTAVKISKICNDLRLLSSGPRTGLMEINLPPMQPGSSIMPGKVNPVIPEVFNQIAYQIIGNDLTITMAAEAGQLQLNVMEPVIAFNVFQSLQILERGLRTLTHKCVVGITANEAHCRAQVNNSISIITALNPYIGYENSTEIARDALKFNRSIVELVLEKKLLSKEQLDTILSPENMVGRG